ncbi:MAG: hypothetical protein A2X48_04185 [Lentisphaerae bacterium GWF2_49_21]|nr:MAG: hypothetical protein A2X48_04185 [Lentisphaerae bacterium GWF2_49_21]
MTFNWLSIPALLGAYILFFLAFHCSGNLKSPKALLLWSALCLVLAVPGLLIAFFYTRIIEIPAWFYEFRSWTGSELTAAGVGLLGGTLAFLSTKTRRLKIISTSGLLLIMTLGVFLPYSKPLIAGAEFDKFHDRWDGQCSMQSTGYSCGAASCATILKYYGLHASEIEIAKDCYTYNGGTEVWYLARYVRKNGLKAQFLSLKIPSADIPVPCIAGVKVGGVGHFIAILEKSDKGYLVADPLVGPRFKDIEKPSPDLMFTGFFMKITD